LIVTYPVENLVEVLVRVNEVTKVVGAPVIGIVVLPTVSTVLVLNTELMVIGWSLMMTSGCMFTTDSPSGQSSTC
jgi:hypothetical protein